jgi:hypothetical protein
MSEDVPQIECYIAGRQGRGRDLVEQWLELLIVVLVDQGNTQIARSS